MQEALKKLEEAIKWHLKEAYLPPHRAKHKEWVHHDLQFFSKGADLLSTAFTEERNVLPKNYFNKKEFRSAYLLYFVLTNFAKTYHVLNQLPAELKNRPLKIADLGCGPGTASLACSAFFKETPLQVFGFEQNDGMRKDALALWKKLAPPHHQFTFSRTPLPRDPVDITIAANFLSELPFGEQLKMCEEALKRSKYLIIIEPALRVTTRKLMELRDKVLQQKWGTVVAPCLHQKNCPMLTANPRDWCHFYIEWKCPQLIRQIDQLVKNKHDYLKMAYFVIESKAKQSPGSGVGDSLDDRWRAVSSPLLSNGKKEIILCGDCGYLKKIERLNKDKSPKNHVFDLIRRGDILQWPNKTRVEKEDKIEITQKF